MEKGNKKALVLGAGGFIGGAMVKRLKKEGYWVRGVDLKYHEYFDITEVADEFTIGDLSDPRLVSSVMFAEGSQHPESDTDGSFDAV